MRRTTKALLSLAPLGLLVSAMLGGCASDPELSRLRDANQVLTSRVQALSAELDECQTTNAALLGSDDQRTSAIAQLQNRNSELQRLVDDQQRTIREFESRLAGLDLGGLDPATDSALRRLAAANPSLMTYDPNRGMIRFASDLTFDSGSDVVKDSAKASLRQLASILNQGAARGYDVQVVGHTDNVPIGNPQTRARFPTNMHLSCARAISVRNELTSMGVPPTKVQAAGWGEFRPAVPNNVGQGTTQNRRVEIYLLEGSDAAGASYAAPTNTGAVDVDRMTPSRPDPTK